MARPGDYDFYCEEAISGNTEIRKVYESETVLAFYHTQPSYPTHIVIVPKEHIHDFRYIGQDLMVEITEVAQKIVSKIDLDPNGARLVTNLGSYQDDPHAHFHVISNGKYPNLKV